MSQAQSGKWLYRLRAVEQPEYRLICLPHAGGGPALFHRWRAAFPNSFEILSVQLPGRASRIRETPYQQMTPLVRDLTDALRPELARLQVQARAPVAFFGHSFGALVAFELIHALQAEGLQPAALFVSACHAPQLLPVDEKLYSLPRRELLAALQRLDGMPQAVLAEVELLDIILPALRADLAVYETYVYRGQPKLSLPIIAFGGRDDIRVTPVQLEAWREQTGGHFERHLFPGNHFYLDDAYPQIIKMIKRTLAI